MNAARAARLVTVLIWAIILSMTTVDDHTRAMTLEDLDLTRRVDWAAAGYPGEIPNITENLVNVKDLGAAADGSADIHDLVQKAINDAPDPAVIYFPAGIYRLESPLTLKTGVVVRGAGSESTRLDCYSDDGCLQIKGNDNGSYRPIVSGLTKGSDQILVDDTSGFRIGQGAEIRQQDTDAIDPESKYEDKGWNPINVVGQMVKIVDIDGRQLTIDPPLHHTFLADRNPEILPVTYEQRIGVEDLTIQRIDTGTISNNINITWAADCWFRRIESDQSQRYHFSISKSLHLEIRTCYIHDAYHKGGGGRGYGTSLGSYVTSVLVEDNIFSDLRHAMIIQLGTNGCVFGYNYAQRNYDDAGYDKTYISVHGHYPYMNLFEGNIVGYAGLADYWGASGPGNTLFRNRMIGTDTRRDFGPYRGIAVNYYSHRQNIIGNELTGGETQITFDGNTDPLLGTSKDVIVHGNNVRGTINWDPAIADHSLPASFYRTTKPAFFDKSPWPAMGPDQTLGSGTIPAVERYNAQAYIPQPSDDPDGGDGGDDGGNGDDNGDSADSGSDGSSSGSGCFIASSQ